MRVEFDREVDAAYIYLKDIQPGEASHQVAIDDEHPRGMIVLDFDDEGRLLGVEVLNARAGLPEQVLKEADAI